MLLDNAEAARKYAVPILRAGAEKVADAQNAQLRSMSFSDRSTGELAGSVKVGKVEPNRGGLGIQVNVYPHGYQKHGFTRKNQRSLVSNAHVGFMFEYGTSKMSARPWRAQADKAAREAAENAMSEKWREVSAGE